MAKRTLVTFEAAFPDEAQWTENGSPLVPDGRGISLVLAEALKMDGLCTSGVSQHNFYGWAFDVLFPRNNVWCLLQQLGPWLLLIEERKHGFGSLLRNARFEGLEMVLRAIDRTLKGDTRFSLIRWFTKQGYESGCEDGADSP